MKNLTASARAAKDIIRHPRLTHRLGFARRPEFAWALAGIVLKGKLEAKRQLLGVLARGPDVRTEKIISHRYRYVWLCVPKVASRSLIRGLRAVDPEAELVVQKTITEVYQAHPEAREYYSFAFVRHPFRRALSFYSELFLFSDQYFARSPQAVTPQRLKKEKLKNFRRDFPGLAETKNFEDYCRWLHTPYGCDLFGERHFLSQHRQLRLEDGRPLDFIGRYETLDKDLATVSATLGMPIPPLPMLNTMSEWEGRPDKLQADRRAREAYLTRRCRALLRARYRDDLRLFGYSPE